MTGNFRTAEDIMEEAATKLANATDSSQGDGGETETMSPSDILDLGKLTCVQKAMTRICETKGMPTFVSWPFSMNH